VDARRSPQRVGLRHLLDQGSNLGIGGLAAADLSPRQPGPKETKAFAMPANDRIGFDDE